MTEHQTADRFGQREELILEFPCDFPIKIVGKAHADFHGQVCEIVARHDERFVPALHLQVRESSAGKYHSFTLLLQATSKEQINAVYQDLKACEWVLWAL